MIEPTFDQVINPHGQWLDDELDYKYTPKHMKRENNIMKKLINVLAKTAVLLALLFAVLWLAGAVTNLLRTILPF